MLVTLADELNVRIALVAVDEVAETLERFLFVEGARPFALVAVDKALDVALQGVGQPQLVVDDHLAQVVDASFQVAEPDRGALQFVGAHDVEHHKTVYQPD